MDPSSKAEAVLGRGRGALILAMSGGGWLAWGLSIAKVFTLPRGILFSVVEIFLVVCSVYLIRKGMSLRKRYPGLPGQAAPNMRKWFLIVLIVEFVAIGIVVNVAYALRRPELVPVWIAMVVGLHFLPLARIFRVPGYAVIGIAMTLWCILCWILFPSDTLAASAAAGSGVMFWAMSAYALLRARHLVHSLQ
jgi:hypothetical protein